MDRSVLKSTAFVCSLGEESNEEDFDAVAVGTATIASKQIKVTARRIRRASFISFSPFFLFVLSQTAVHN
jgi:hypothetical protein